MTKSRKVGTTARELRTLPKTQQFTVLLTHSFARGLHLLAEKKGVKASQMFREWLTADYVSTFGEELK